MLKENLLVVLVTTPREDAAEARARPLIEGGFAACVNIIPSVRSIYNWEGKLNDENEALMFIKTTEEAFSELEDKIRKLHSYDCPEIVAIRPHHVFSKYASWVESEVKTGK